jgi:outer membrane protein OmpA-like peptidoglycan-associated protein
MKKLYLFVLLSVFCYTAFCQYAGLNASNWAGITTISQNPAIADNRYHIDIALGGILLAANNNSIGVPSKSIVFNPLINQSANVDFFADNMFGGGNIVSRKSKMFNATKRTQIQGPLSFLVAFGLRNENAIGFSYHLNFIKNVHGVNGDFYNYFNNFFNSSNSILDTKEFKNQSFGITSYAWSDFGITYSRVLLDKNEHMFKGGITLKYIQGMSAEYLNASNVDVTFYNKYRTAYFDNATFNYSRTENVLSLSKFNLNFGQAKPTFGADFGFVYEWRPKIAEHRYTMDGLKNIRARDEDLHLIAVGLSLTDIGVINFSKAPQVKSFNLNGYYSNTSEFSNNYDFKNGGYQRLEAFVSDTAYAKPRSSPDNFKIPLPMRITMFMDVNIKKGFGVNLNARIYPTMTKSVLYARDVSTFTLTPRYDIKWFGAYLPISVDVNKNFNLGISARLGPVFFGFQNLLAWFLPKGVFNGEFFASAHIPIPYKKPKDSDRDLVSDKVDLCKMDFGTWETKGCPDDDSDGVYNNIDLCPDVAGDIRYFGCPDSDGDGLTDKNDSCPDVFGKLELQGCPDFDEDGVPDKDDKCPTIKGKSCAFGCPDRDNDCVPDALDECPNTKGLVELKGCPDGDGDGTSDKYDKCPKLKGSKDHYGCPDSDEDGVFDDEDLDPQHPGTKENKGKPDIDEESDMDGDGVPDIYDRCADEKGIKLYNGCPTPKHANEQADDVNYGDILFDEGETQPSPAGRMLLDQFIASRKKSLDNTSGYNFIILLKAYADKNEGSSAREKEALSQKRLFVVRDYLKKNGIPEELMQGDFVGDAESIANSETEVNRKKNRVVRIIERFKR